MDVSNDFFMGDSTESDDEARKKALLPKVQQAAPGTAKGGHRHHRSMVREEIKWMEVASSEGWEGRLIQQRYAVQHAFQLAWLPGWISVSSSGSQAVATSPKSPGSKAYGCDSYLTAPEAKIFARSSLSRLRPFRAFSGLDQRV
jgi:hypothetical protein